MTKKNNLDKNQSPSYTVKVGDLLRKQGSSDTISLGDFMINENIAHLSGKITLTSTSEQEVIINTKDLKWSQHTICDYCGTEFDSQKSAHDEMYSALLLNKIPDETDELFFPIQSDMSLDLYSVLYNTVMFYNDVQNVCETCAKRLEQEDINSGFGGEVTTTPSNIVFK